MTGFKTLTANALPMIQDNIDTDQILPKQFLNAVDREGFGKHLFHDWRYLDDRESVPNPDFVLNASRYKKAQILLTGMNFGCGSSREHAPWALADYGFKVIIAGSFGDIFYGNCINNNMLLITLPMADIEHIASLVRATPHTPFKIDLQYQMVSVAHHTYDFDIDERVKHNLIHGLDRIGLTLSAEQAIQTYEANRPSFMP
jgi:3-isopropylmalate/(R)-2-methylmalate dehydratase small subunit